jgi:acyl-CoA dehydrogenase
MSTHESMIAASVERMLADASPSDGFDAALWHSLAEAGVPRLLRPESQGGAGDAWRDAAAVLQAAGARAAPVPLADALVAHAVLAAAGFDADDVPIRVAVASPDGRPDDGDGTAPDGASVLELSPWGEHAHCTWRAAGAAPRTFEIADASTVRARLALAAAATITGAMRTAIALGVEYAGVRRAFGRTIGAFQAVQHPLATAAEEVAAARAALDWAAAQVEAGDGRVAAAVAKARASEAAGRVAAVVHQVHGAIGFTAEYPLHRASRVMWRWRDRWGDEHDWNAALGAQALAAGAEGLFDLLDGGPPGARTSGGDAS